MKMFTRDRQFYRTMFGIALPAAFQGLIAQLVNLADNVMVGSLGTAQLAGVSQSFSITSLFNGAILGLVSGSSVLISQYWGKRDEKRIRQVFCVVMTLMAGLSLLVTALIRLMPARILGLVVSDPAVLEAALPYFSLICLSYIPYALSQALIGMLRSVEIVNVSLTVSMVSLLANIALNYVLIFGKLGIPAMGVRGAAMATLIARMIELGIVWIYAFYGQKKLSLRPRNLLCGSREMWVDYMRYGLPVGLGDMQWSLIGVFKAAIVGALGATVMAANAIGSQLFNLGMLFTNALAQGACIVIGKTVGAGNYAKTREYSVSIQWIFLLFGIAIAAAVYLLREWFVGLYQPDADVQRMTVRMIALSALTLVGTCYHASCFVGINRGGGDSRFVMIVDMICGWLIVLPVCYLTAFVWKVEPSWMFFFLRIDQCFKWIIAFLRLRGDRWIRNVTRA